MKISILLFALLFLLGCESKNKEKDLDVCITQANGLFSQEKLVDKSWHIVGCMESRGYEFIKNELSCQIEYRTFISKCYE